MKEEVFSTQIKGWYFNLISLLMTIIIIITFVLLISDMSPKEFSISMSVLISLVSFAYLGFLFLLKWERVKRILIIDQEVLSIKYGEKENKIFWKDIDLIEVKETKERIKEIKLFTANKKTININNFENMSQVYDKIIGILSDNNVPLRKISMKYNLNAPLFILSIPVFVFLICFFFYHLWF